MRRLLLIGVSLALLAATPAAAQDGSDDPFAGLTSFKMYTQSDGASADVSGPTITFSFTNRSRRAINAFRGRRVFFGCEHSPALNPAATPAPPSKIKRIKVGKHATKLKARVPFAASYDLCLAFARVGKRVHVVALATTPGGVTTLAEAKIAGEISGAVGVILEMSTTNRVPTIDAALAKLGKLLVALPHAGATPDLGKIGYWSDGDQHLVVAAMSPSGRRLFYELQSNGVLSENIEPLLMFDLFGV